MHRQLDLLLNIFTTGIAAKAHQILKTTDAVTAQKVKLEINALY